MSTQSISTRRSLLKGGAFLAAPLAVAAPIAAMAEDDRKARLALLEGEAAIRDLHQAWLRRINTGADALSLFADPGRAAFDADVRGIAPDHAAAPDAIAIAADGLSARGRFHCLVEFETAIPRDSTLAQMAHVQGGGVVRRTETRVLKAEYVMVDGAWAISKVDLASA